MSVQITVDGTAAPQGSMNFYGNGRMKSTAKGLPKWRKAVIAAAKATHGEDFDPMDGALEVNLRVYLLRPKTTKFRDYPAGPPDLDKLQRAIGDALKLAGTITDDARIVTWRAHKEWAIGCPPGAEITIRKKGTR
jgi:crossover junction endodeoxyribonuclease RusA